MKHFLLSLVAVATLCVPATAQNRVKNLYASSNTLDLAQLQDMKQPVQLNRLFLAGYNTLCLPMSVAPEQLMDIKLERLVGIQQEGNTLNLYFLDCTGEGIEAGYPYLIYSPKTQYLRLKNTDVKAVGDCLQTVCMSDNEGNTITFGSSWEAIAEFGRYGIPAKQDVFPLESVLVRTESDKTFLPTRCGFEWKEQASGATDLCIKHIKSLSEATGINAVVGAQTVRTDVYDLSGRKVNAAKKGIVIENGKKVLVK
ncbi:MAG: hypothetical protein IJ762_10080 [Bacteroidaceae bacterium]|nr:hypothetical protein [Bacteroidaceae bacterium]